MENKEKVPNNWTVPAKSFVDILLVNVDNKKLSDSEFRKMVRNTIPIVEKGEYEKLHDGETKKSVRKYYQ